MENVPYNYKKESSESKLGKLLPVLATAIAGLAVGTTLHDELPKNKSSLAQLASSTVPNCQAKHRWGSVPPGTNFEFLAGLLGVDVERATTARSAVVDCDLGLMAGQVLSRPIDVSGQTGPCLAAEVLSSKKPASPTQAFHEVIAVCAGPKPQGNQIIT